MADSEVQNLYYADYIELDKILASQHPRSFETASPADDELLFIIVHQAFELWFKQILFELDRVRSIFAQEHINDNTPDMSTVVHKLKRVVKILELLNRQFDVLEMMTPLDFLEFRNILVPASGFQSLQFRLIEARLGLKMDQRYKAEYYKRANRGGLSGDDLQMLEQAEAEDTLKDLVLKWLERMPFMDAALWKDYQSLYGAPGADFWNDYTRSYRESLSENEKGRLAEFEKIFFKDGLGTFSAAATKSVLFIMLYRGFPIFHMPFALLTALIDIDELLSSWRYKHLLMVRRMIGMRVGTGGSSGAGYLEGTLIRHYTFKELTEITTFIVERSKLPELPQALKEKMSFNP